MNISTSFTPGLGQMTDSVCGRSQNMVVNNLTTLYNFEYAE